MKKSIFISVATLSCFISSSAYTATKNMSGFYVGLHGGYELAKGKVRGDQTFNDAGFLQAVKMSKKSITIKGLLAGAHFGYQYDFGRFLAGIELFSTHSRNKTNKNFTFGRVEGLRNDGSPILNMKLKYRRSYGSNLRLGYKIIPDWVVGMKLGYVRSRFIIENKNNIYLYRAVPYTAFLSSSKKRINRNSFSPGIYLDKYISSYLFLGGEYSYTKNKKITSLSSGVVSYDGAANLQNRVNCPGNLKLHTHDFKLRLGYKF